MRRAEIRKPAVAIQADKRLETLVDGVRDYALCLLDAKGRIETWNTGAERICGWRAHEVGGQSISILYTDASRAAGKPELDLQEADRAGRVEDDGWRRRKDGSRLWANVVVTALRDVSGGLIGFACVMRDLTITQEASGSGRANDEFRLLIANVTDYAIYLLDPHGFVVSWNVGAERIKGYHAQEIIGRHFSAFYSPEDIRAHKPEREIEEATRVGRVEDEGWHVRKDGTRFWANTVITALRGPDQKLIGFAKITRDLTERKRAEESSRRLEMEQVARNAAERAEHEAKRHAERLAALVASEAEARQIAEHAVNRIAQLQATTAALAEALTASEAAEATMRQGLGLFGAFAGSIFLVSEDRQRLDLLISHGHRPEFAIELESVPISADRPVASVARKAAPVLLSSLSEIQAAFPEFRQQRYDSKTRAALLLPLLTKGVVMGVVALNFDSPRTFNDEDLGYAAAVAQQCALAIERARLVEEQRTSTERANFLAEASALLGASIESETILDKLARLIVPRIADWCAIEMVDADTTRQVAVAHSDPRHGELAVELRDKCRLDRAASQGLFEVIRTGKPQIYSEVSEALLAGVVPADTARELIRKFELSSAVIVPLLAHDRCLGAISLVSAESKRKYDRSDLEFLMEIGRRAGLAVDNAGLYRELQTAVRARDDFLAVAGHELKTPLAALLLHIQSLQRLSRRNPVLSALADRIDKAANSGARLEKLITQLLDVSRITTGHLRLDPERFDLTDLVEQVAARFVEAAAKANTPLRVRTTRIQGTWDRVRIEQVVTNLLSNALKYGRAKPVDVALECEPGWAVISVEDRGIGIAIERQQKIFERFERAVANRNFGGFGLGLWITRQIVEAAGGTISVRSEPDCGAKFTVRLPLG